MEYLLGVNEAAFFSPTQKRDVLKVVSIGKKGQENWQKRQAEQHLTGRHLCGVWREPL